MCVRHVLQDSGGFVQPWAMSMSRPDNPRAVACDT